MNNLHKAFGLSLILLLSVAVIFARISELLTQKELNQDSDYNKVLR
jgi:hypothetical protein